MSGLTKGNLEYPSIGKKKLIKVTQKSEKKKIAEAAKWEKGMSKAIDRMDKALDTGMKVVNYLEKRAEKKEAKQVKAQRKVKIHEYNIQRLESGKGSLGSKTLTGNKSLGAGMLKEIRRKMMKHIPGRTKKTY